MPNSKRNMDSSLQHRSSYLYTPDKNTTNDIISMKLIPKMTSTPVLQSTQPSPSHWTQNESNFCATPKIKPAMSRSRYSLSDTNAPCPSSDRNRSYYGQNTSGPLLASTHFLNNVGTYMDSKSPGLTSRVVQYNESESKATHQARYNKPGVFPIVHLFKKDIPVLSPKLKRVTVRVATSDLCLYNTPEHNKLLLEGALQDPVNVNSSCQESSENDTGTRSVLEALKEISRKRIHSSEQLEVVDDNRKRQRKECLQVTKEQNKQIRNNLPKAPNSANCVRPSTCVIDPITASLTSSNLYYGQLAKGVKRKAESAVKNNQKQEKQIKFSNAETQTINAASDDQEKELQSSEPNPSNEYKGDTQHTTTENAKEITEPIIFEKIFDDKPLEITRRNRLAVLLGALTGEKPQLIQPEDRLQTFNGAHQNSSEVEKKPVSIISPQNKAKHDKHVTFSVPEAADSKTTPSANDTNVTLNSNDNFKPAVNATFVSNGDSAAVNNISKISSESDVLPLKVSSPTFSSSNAVVSSPVFSSLMPKENLPLQPATGFSLDSIKPSLSTTNVTTTAAAVSMPTFVFNKSESPKLTSTSNTAPVPEIGGFKFNLPLGGMNKSSTSSSALQIVPNNPTAVTSNNLTVNASGNLFSKTVDASSSFVPITIKSGFTSEVPNSSAFSSAPKLQSGLTSYEFSANSKSLGFGLATPASSAAPSASTVLETTSVFSVPKATSSIVGFSTGVAMTSPPILGATASETFSFKTSPISVAPSVGQGFASSLIPKNPVSTNTSESLSQFGSSKSFSFISTTVADQAKASLNAAVSKSLEGTTVSSVFTAPVSSSGFGANTNASSGIATTSIFTAPASSSGFLVNANASSNALSFGVNATSTGSSTQFQNIFSTSTNIFGVNTATTSASKVATVPSCTSMLQFGSPTTTNSASVFGVATTTAGSYEPSSKQPPSFGTGKTFGSDNTLTFGSNTAVNPGNNSFGSVPGNGFGSGTSTFGGSSISLFGSNVTNNVNTQKLDASKGFGLSAPFAVVPSQTTQQKQESNSEFGAAFTGSTAAPVFNTNPPSNAFQLNDTQKPAAGFSASATNPTFGKTQVTMNSFMSPSNSNFSSPVTASASFGSTSSNTNNVFGASGIAQINPPAFTFNSASQPTFSFGTSGNASIVPSTNKIFSFGPSETPKSGDVNFSAHTPALGSSSAFGVNAATTAPTFGTNFVPQFNAPTAGTFSIGSGTTTPSRSRTHLKAKRRT